MAANHILIVECEKGLQRVLALILKRSAFVISVVATCNEVVEKISESKEMGAPVNLLILDLNIRDDSCAGIPEKLTQHGQELPIIALVGYGDEEKVEKKFREKCSLFVSKPIEEFELIGGINKVLRIGESVDLSESTCVN